MSWVWGTACPVKPSVAQPHCIKNWPCEGASSQAARWLAMSVLWIPQVPAACCLSLVACPCHAPKGVLRTRVCALCASAQCHMACWHVLECLGSRTSERWTVALGAGGQPAFNRLTFCTLIDRRARRLVAGCAGFVLVVALGSLPLIAHCSLVARCAPRRVCGCVCMCAGCVCVRRVLVLACCL